MSMSTSTRTHFPFTRWIIRKLTGRWSRRICLSILALFLITTTLVRLRSYFMTRKIQAVLHGLAQIRIDQTTEEELKKTVPYLTKYEWAAGGQSRRGYFVKISTESDARVLGLIAYSLDWASGGSLIGYRYIGFDAGVIVRDGKVSQVEYGLADQWMRPQFAGYVGYIVSARSVHGFWPRYLQLFRGSSSDDTSPQYRPFVNNCCINVIYTSDAPAELTNRIFQLDLTCFWGLRGCSKASDIAPALAHDAQSIQAATLDRLRAGKCPDSIAEARMKYLPDASVLLLEVTGSRRVQVNEDGYPTEDWFTDYKLKEVIRGQNPQKNDGSWKNIRLRRTTPSPTDPTELIANPIWSPDKIGTQVLFFGGLYFDSCRFIPATPSALEIARKTPVPSKRPEDEIPTGLQ
jgi:hypothetical protein